MKKFSLVALAGIALTVAGTLEAGGNHDYKGGYHDYKGGKAGFEFALIGDTPYGVLPGVEYQPFDRVVSDINADRKIKWVMHAGDIKGGSTPCSDEMFNDRLTRYNAFSKPVILTLGDNEWTDCHRIAAGEYQPLERLAKLREIFYAEPGKVTIGQQSMMVQTQATNLEYANYPENVWWQRRGVMFAAIHVVGSRNGLAPFADGSAAVRTEADDAE
ncbi:MAG: metallophosphoesterase, partial [Pseudomonadales bacterium]|nr:metallophosphoesterase [Pseudomonadales bacterium]